ncbi:MarR family winged helix-turn-helix transcriptional regulator [Paraglaciecola sp. L3A3]|uniref:MarR family winged helix-turn-helix transcriptional regulator n=1 Tax=Paraglaciecola sp. L3A3 TaxID=2686358 RepID=UPI00131D4347|nr:MarR family transcriptional regulator [Paraglaciecola sp. L3A3]
MELSEVLFSLFHNVRNNISQQVKLLDLDVSPMHMKSLKVISTIEDCTGQKLADFMGRDKAQVNRLLKELVSQELVIKTENKNDGRSQILSLSSRGREFMGKFKQIESQVFNAMVKDIAPEDIENFTRLAKIFRHNLQ